MPSPLGAADAALAPAPRAVRTAAVLGLGHALPAQVVPNGPIARRIGVDDAWIQRRTGVRMRRHLAEGERMTDLAIEAGRRALADAGIPASRLDRIVVATMSPDEITPNTSPLVADALGAADAGAFNVDAACTGFVASLDLAASLVETGRADLVLVIGAEALSRLTDFDDRVTAALFADGAGAVVLGADGEGAIGPMVLRADGGRGEAIVADRIDGKLRMNGVDTFKIAVSRLTEVTREACERSGRSLDDIDLFVYHQANARILKSVAERLDLPSARVADYVGEMANTSAASIPLTLSLARADGRLRKGHQVLVAAIGAGFTWGAGVIDWGLS